MLEHLHVKNLALIDEIEVDFSEGLNILSGETGAGKSIIIGSINLALGGKANKDFIRKGAEYGLVEVIFRIDSQVKINRIEELGITVEDNRIIISKKITQTRCISKVNGENVTNSMLKKLAELVIDIHGQHQNQSLLVKNNHINLLDKFAKDSLGDLLDELKKNYDEYISAKKELDIAAMDEEQRLREISFLEFEINEIQSANLHEGEDEELTVRYKKLSNMNTILSSLAQVHNELSDSIPDSAANSISRGVKILSRVNELDEVIDEQLQQLITIDNILSDLNKDIVCYMDNCEDVSEELSQVEERLNTINGLKMKYGNDISDIIEYCEEQEKKLIKLKNYDEYVDSLKNKVGQLENKLDMISGRVSSIRKEKSQELVAMIKGALIDLNFIDVRFEMLFDRTKGYTDKGYDDVQFYISTNPGESLRPLCEVASGGEISRIMLAIKSVLANVDDLDSLIFDEIDTGISGRTAQKVSEKLALIANNRQVICITHLPQIAAMADVHYVIGKYSNGEKTYTDIKKLSNKDAVKEVARILGGVQITEAVLYNAKEMIQLAKGIKSNLVA